MKAVQIKSYSKAIQKLFKSNQYNPERYPQTPDFRLRSADSGKGGSS